MTLSPCDRQLRATLGGTLCRIVAYPPYTHSWAGLCTHAAINTKPSCAPTLQAGASKKQVDWGKEEVFFESAPHRGDLAVNIALGATLVWLPLSIAAIGRGAFVKYRFTDKRISVVTSAPWKSEQPSRGPADSKQQRWQQALPL